MSKHTLIVAFGQVHANAIAKAEDIPVSAWSLVQTRKDITRHSAASTRVIFCETSRSLADYDDIVSVAQVRGYDVPSPLYKWGAHAASLSGAFKLLEQVQGVSDVHAYRTMSSRGNMSTYLGTSLVMCMQPNGLFIFAKKGECLRCPS